MEWRRNILVIAISLISSALCAYNDFYGYTPSKSLWYNSLMSHHPSFRHQQHLLQTYNHMKHYSKPPQGRYTSLSGLRYPRYTKWAMNPQKPNYPKPIQNVVKPQLQVGYLPTSSAQAVSTFNHFVKQNAIYMNPLQNQFPKKYMPNQSYKFLPQSQALNYYLPGLLPSATMKPIVVASPTPLDSQNIVALQDTSHALSVPEPSPSSQQNFKLPLPQPTVNTLVLQSPKYNFDTRTPMSTQSPKTILTLQTPNSLVLNNHKTPYSAQNVKISPLSYAGLNLNQNPINYQTTPKPPVLNLNYNFQVTTQKPKIYYLDSTSTVKPMIFYSANAVQKPQQYYSENTMQKTQPYTFESTSEKPQPYYTENTSQKPETYYSENTAQKPQTYYSENTVPKTLTYYSENTVQKPQTYYSENTAQKQQPYLPEQTVQKPQQYNIENSEHKLQPYLSEHTAPKTQQYYSENTASKPQLSYLDNTQHKPITYYSKPINDQSNYVDAYSVINPPKTFLTPIRVLEDEGPIYTIPAPNLNTEVNNAVQPGTNPIYQYYDSFSYEIPGVNYEEHKPTYEEPKPTHEEPKPTYEEPKPTYEEPKPTYEEPKQTYVTSSANDVKPTYEVTEPTNEKMTVTNPPFQFISQPITENSQKYVQPTSISNPHNGPIYSNQLQRPQGPIFYNQAAIVTPQQQVLNAFKAPIIKQQQYYRPGIVHSVPLQPFSAIIQPVYKPETLYLQPVKSQHVSRPPVQNQITNNQPVQKQYAKQPPVIKHFANQQSIKNLYANALLTQAQYEIQHPVKSQYESQQTTPSPYENPQTNKVQYSSQQSVQNKYPNQESEQNTFINRQTEQGRPYSNKPTEQSRPYSNQQSEYNTYSKQQTEQSRPYSNQPTEKNVYSNKATESSHSIQHTGNSQYPKQYKQQHKDVYNNKQLEQGLYLNKQLEKTPYTNQYTEQNQYTSQQSENSPYKNQYTGQNQYTNQQSEKGHYINQYTNQIQYTSQPSEKNPYVNQHTEQNQYTSQQSELNSYLNQLTKQNQYINQQTEKTPYLNQLTEQNEYTSQQPEQTHYTDKNNFITLKPEKNNYVTQESENGHYSTHPVYRYINNQINKYEIANTDYVPITQQQDSTNVHYNIFRNTEEDSKGSESKLSENNEIIVTKSSANKVTDNAITETKSNVFIPTALPPIESNAVTAKTETPSKYDHLKKPDNELASYFAPMTKKEVEETLETIKAASDMINTRKQEILNKENKTVVYSTSYPQFLPHSPQTYNELYSFFQQSNNGFVPIPGPIKPTDEASVKTPLRIYIPDEPIVTSDGNTISENNLHKTEDIKNIELDINNDPQKANHSQDISNQENSTAETVKSAESPSNNEASTEDDVFVFLQTNNTDPSLDILTKNWRTSIVIKKDAESNLADVESEEFGKKFLAKKE